MLTIFQWIVSIGENVGLKSHIFPEFYLNVISIPQEPPIGLCLLFAYFSTLSLVKVAN